jgi:2-C-methyl-D-erythritol 4-phosphate cytidylyltransferase
MTAADGEAAAVIAAAGSGDRLQADRPKALVALAGRPLLAWSLDALAGAASVSSVVIAAPPGHERDVERLTDGAELQTRVVAGGTTRSESVAAAIALVDSDVTVVQDAARPLVTPELIDAVVADLNTEADAEGIVVATPVSDTIKQVLRGREIERTLDRSSLWAAQTPQAFRTDALRRAIGSTELLSQATDDAMLLERIGGRVLLHEAPGENLKVTTELDLRVAELLLSERVR